VLYISGAIVIARINSPLSEEWAIGKFGHQNVVPTMTWSQRHLMVIVCFQLALWQSHPSKTCDFSSTAGKLLWAIAHSGHSQRHGHHTPGRPGSTSRFVTSVS
jgi:hypothetical protein